MTAEPALNDSVSNNLEISKKSQLAIHGGEPAVSSAIPGRRQFDEAVLKAVEGVFLHAWEEGRDFGYQGAFEREYLDEFVQFQGGGYADAVATGTTALLVALAALQLPAGSEVVLPPVTDPGGVTPAILLGHPVRVADAAEAQFNTSLAEIQRVVTPTTSVVIVAHIGGMPLDIEPVADWCRERGIKLIEDCSQAHGTTIDGRKVGTYGDIAVFSTMFSKNHSSGGCGGIVYTRDAELYQQILAYADRGKTPWVEDFDPKNPSQFLCAALNLHQDEISSAIGRVTLSRLPEVNLKRNRIVEQIASALSATRGFRALSVGEAVGGEGIVISPFFLTICVELAHFSASLSDITTALIAEGVPMNPRYAYVVSEWPWLRTYCAAPPVTPNVLRFRDSSFNILFHERFTEENVGQIITALNKVEREWGI